mmetsp:Transcript_20981/g.28864  ORF Transcript_20981/g.28864 Transcript_20981/m.28864 type:complete len:365 (-) Transcript_20981:653-1747(-)
MISINDSQGMSRLNSLCSTMRSVDQEDLDENRDKKQNEDENTENYDYSKSADSYGISASSSYEIRSDELNDNKNNSNDDKNITVTESNDSDNFEDNQDDEKASKKPRTNYRDPRRLANIKAAIDLLLQQEETEGESRKSKNLKEVSRQFNIPYNTLRDNFLRTTTGQVRHSSVKQVLKTRRMMGSSMMHAGMAVHDQQLIPIPIQMAPMMQLQSTGLLNSHHQQQLSYSLNNGSIIYCAMPFVPQHSNIIQLNQLNAASQLQNHYSHTQQLHLVENNTHGHSTHNHNHANNNNNSGVCFMNSNGVYFAVQDEPSTPSIHSFRPTPQQLLAASQVPLTAKYASTNPSSSHNIKNPPDSDKPPKQT